MTSERELACWSVVAVAAQDKRWRSNKRQRDGDPRERKEIKKKSDQFPFREHARLACEIMGLCAGNKADWMEWDGMDMDVCLSSLF